ncbi:MAG: RdgB/HAM1 family non-canonical purine NTP pyrophosphatase [Lentisphaeria bacterium]|nr:RdgB/HAM1 family non-canonical purine NTP pyrophosphatase [Lentisphaeria bacterium]
MTVIVAATANLHKFEEYRAMLGDQGAELHSLLDYPGFTPSEETGKTFKENASMKALEACKYTDRPTFADDSGLEITALDNAPGIYSARYGKDDTDRINRVLRELEGKTDRSARFVCVIAIAINGEVIETFEGVMEGTIIDAPRGENGFGYDPIFVPKGETRTFAEMSSDEKNKISHRAKALQKALEFIEDEMSVLDDDFDF